jgi:hypothetical protein
LHEPEKLWVELKLFGSTILLHAFFDQFGGAKICGGRHFLPRQTVLITREAVYPAVYITIKNRVIYPNG